MHPTAALSRNAWVTVPAKEEIAMPRTVEVKHQVWIQAPAEAVRSQFADLYHHIETNVHPKLKFEVLALEPRRARFTQEVKLLGLKQRDLFERTIDDDGSIHDVSVDGFNKGGSLDFVFTPTATEGREGTEVDITIRLPVPRLMGWLAPVLASQVRREVTAAALEDKYDLEQRGYRSNGLSLRA
jgi:uncharacterized membrane protein